MAITFASIDLISGVGRFENWTPAAELPKLRRYCLYYGFNGTGKSSIARSLGTFGQPVYERRKVSHGRIRVTLSTGDSLSETDEAAELRNRIFVFSSDFVDENFRWKEGFATPVFYIGKAQSDIALRLNALREQLPKEVDKQTKLRSRMVKADRLFVEFKRERARQIETELGATRSYRSPNLDADYDALDREEVTALSTEEAASLRTFLGSVGQFSPVDRRSTTLEDIPGIRHHALAELLRHVPQNDALLTLGPYPEMQGWAVDGAKYHTEKELEWCLHCGGELDQQSRRRLAWLNDDSIIRFREEIGQAMVALDRNRNSVRADISRLVDPAAIVPSLRDRAKAAHEKLSAAATELERQLALQTNHLTEKLNTLDKAFMTLPGMDGPYEGAFSEYKAQYTAYQSVLEEHNAIVANAEAEVFRARDRLKRSLLKDGLDQYTVLGADLRELTSELEKADQVVSGLTRDIADFESQLRDHRAAADLISTSITRYLGHGELTIEAEDEGFRICRDGRPVEGPLSEGERTAIAFCYFLTLLEAEGRKIADAIVILDDPISSLDSGSLNYTASLIAARLADAAQVIVLTHNIHFMHEIKKWIRRLEGQQVFKDHLASVYFVENYLRKNGVGRGARIVRMSKLLHAYESEYHFIFDLILRCARDPGEDETFTYLLPNALRKLLDTFLAFKEPKSESVESRTARLALEFEALDATRLNAVMRMLQTESHADSITDGSTLSAIPIEETRAACRAVLKFIRTVDERHFDVMCDVCGCTDGAALAV